MNNADPPIVPPKITQDDVDAAHAVAHESDRGCVLVLAAQADDALERVLCSFFPVNEPKLIAGLFRGYGPLESLSAKIAVCRALGLITADIRKRLEALRRLRNDFAHNRRPLTLDSQRCADRLLLLVGDARAQEALVRSYLGRTQQGSEVDAALSRQELELEPAIGRRLALGLSVTKMFGNIEGYAAGRLTVMGAMLALGDTKNE